MKAADWLDDLPKGWRGLRLKRVVSLSGQREVEPAPDEYYVGMENIESWTGRLLERGASTPDPDEEPESKSTSNRFSPGNVLFGKLRPYLAKVWLADRAGICSTELLVFQGRDRVYAPFLAHVLRTHEFIDAVDGTTFGSRMPQADWASIGDIQIPLPPLDQQRTIADHLDRETRRIDDLIAAKLRWLDGLSEKRKALILLAVGYGITDSLSRPHEAPAHWTRMALKYACSGIRTGGTPTPEYMDADDDKDVLWFTPGDFNDGLLLADSTRKLSQESIADEQAPLYPPHTVYVVGIGATLGKVGYCSVAASANQQVNALLPAPNTDSTFLAYRLSVAGDWMQALANSATLPILNQQRMGEMEISLPPLAEQRAIVAHIGAETTKLDSLRAATERSLALLRERRAALVAEAVTGRLAGVV
ncbi:MAG: restriction endonuclease subunit S [Opitutaceae bacterium]|jgi:type I restriction enzyme S subunit|nr:restriction endonuclease subunit S [Opitutaceae bacterium]